MKEERNGDGGLREVKERNRKVVERESRGGASFRRGRTSMKEERNGEV